MTEFAVRSLMMSHFRSHKRVRIEVDARPVAIFGPNGAGKTNLLEAVSLLSPGRGLRRAAADDMGRRPEAIGWKVRAEVTASGGGHEIETFAEPGGPRQVLIDGKAAAQIALGRILRMVWLIPAMDRLWIEGADGRRRFLDRMVMSFAPEHGEAALAYEKAMRERNRLLKDMVRDGAWYRAVEGQMAEAGAAIHAGRQRTLVRLAAAQDGAETTFPAADLALSQADGSEFPDAAENFALALAQSRPRDMAAGRTLIGPHRADLGAIWAAKGIEARNCSTGEQKALLISLMLANARALAEDFGAPPILLLDEVAAHLDADRRAALYDEIAALGAQAWMTGTGPELFEAMGPRSQYIEVTEEAGESRVLMKDLS